MKNLKQETTNKHIFVSIAIIKHFSFIHYKLQLHYVDFFVI